MLSETGSMKDTLENAGFIYRDNFLPNDVFQNLNQEVIKSWHKGTGWRTRVKGTTEAKVLPLQSLANVQKIRSLLNKQMESRYSGFSYLYHSLHQDNDEVGLVSQIRTEVIKGWSAEIRALIGHWDQTNFSLTAYTPFCFLDMHTDYVPDAARYKLTLLLYFGGEGMFPEQADLVFDYRGQKTAIPAIPNRSVLFVPSPETNHGIPSGSVDPSIHFCRLAFSGWLL
ncbi:2OG-Fe(II) oxygenase [Xenorhabdus anantnagensis]|uniref:2OG-Fe(II) oxygenase n=1 Tax=Xenorhabdus anantnagensis TaxID=3025875 RepID=A0ABT5LTJ4_9GAMM|nr:2OG-Fe(II) oxygenase [Xenorhabdus anantnagensis]MDC9597093.1 2OG-Fe(II) oxygenase [Xenorhabdus anantnagensis]